MIEYIKTAWQQRETRRLPMYEDDPTSRQDMFIVAKQPHDHDRMANFRRGLAFGRYLAGILPRFFGLMSVSKAMRELLRECESTEQFDDAILDFLSDDYLRRTVSSARFAEMRFGEYLPFWMAVAKKVGGDSPHA